MWDEKLFGFLMDVWPILAVALPLLLVAFVLARVYGAMRRARLERIVYERHFTEEGVYEGETVELVETVRNTGFFPLLFVDIESYFYDELEVEGCTPDPDSTMPYAVSRFHLWPYMEIKRRHTVTARKRGRYALHIATIYRKNAPIAVEAPASLYVYPKAVPLHLFPVAVGRLQGEFASRRPLYTDPFSIAGIRDYRFGDAISHINFKASARVPVSGFSVSPWKVNAPDHCSSRRLMVYMDFHLPEGEHIVGEDYERRTERGLSFCAALIRDAVYEGYAVGFAANCRTVDGGLVDRKAAVRFPCDHAEHHLIAIMKAMAGIRAAEGASFASLVDEDICQGMRDTEVIVLAFGDPVDARDRLNELERMGNSVHTVVLENEEVTDGVA